MAWSNFGRMPFQRSAWAGGKPLRWQVSEQQEQMGTGSMEQRGQEL